MERVTAGMKGIYRDILKDEYQRVFYDSGWNNNTIVDRCRMLLAGFMRGDSSSGIKFLAVGQGDPAWDDLDSEDIPSPSQSTSTDLVDPHSPPVPAASLDFAYLDENDNAVSGPTTRLQISATLGPAYPPPQSGATTYPLREFGLFGEYDGSNYMINSIRHPVIHKGDNATLIRVVRLYF